MYRNTKSPLINKMSDNSSNSRICNKNYTKFLNFMTLDKIKVLFFHLYNRKRREGYHGKDS